MPNHYPTLNMTYTAALVLAIILFHSKQGNSDATGLLAHRWRSQAVQKHRQQQHSDTFLGTDRSNHDDLPRSVTGFVGRSSGQEQRTYGSRTMKQRNMGTTMSQRSFFRNSSGHGRSSSLRGSNSSENPRVQNNVINPIPAQVTSGGSERATNAPGQDRSSSARGPDGSERPRVQNDVGNQIPLQSREDGTNQWANISPGQDRSSSSMMRGSNNSERARVQNGIRNPIPAQQQGRSGGNQWAANNSPGQGRSSSMSGSNNSERSRGSSDQIPGQHGRYGGNHWGNTSPGQDRPSSLIRSNHLARPWMQNDFSNPLPAQPRYGGANQWASDPNQYFDPQQSAASDYYYYQQPDLALAKTTFDSNGNPLITTVVGPYPTSKYPLRKTMRQTLFALEWRRNMCLFVLLSNDDFLLVQCLKSQGMYHLGPCFPFPQFHHSPQQLPNNHLH